MSNSRYGRYEKIIVALTLLTLPVQFQTVPIFNRRRSGGGKKVNSNLVLSSDQSTGLGAQDSCVGATSPHVLTMKINGTKILQSRFVHFETGRI